MTVELPLPIPFNEGFLEVSDIHQIYYAEYGNSHGIPAVVNHGGPGSGSKPKHALNFDLEKYRVVLYDQRGAGKSEPSAEMEENTTPELVEDIERLRVHLGIDKCLLTGGSWGSTLSLLYAQKYPENVSALVVNGVFLAEHSNTDWIHGKNGAAKIFPDAYEKYLALLTGGECDDPVKAYAKRLTSGTQEEMEKAALYAMEWEGGLCGMEGNNKAEGRERAEKKANATGEELEKILDAENAWPQIALTMARTEWHFDANRFFIEEGQILKNISKIRHIPTVIVHGRYDMVCPMENAWKLHKALPESELVIVSDAGHGTSEVQGSVQEAYQKFSNVL